MCRNTDAVIVMITKNKAVEKILKTKNIKNSGYMLTISNSLKAHNFPNFQPILMILASKFMVYRALSDKLLLITASVPFNV